MTEKLSTHILKLAAKAQSEEAIAALEDVANDVVELETELARPRKLVEKQRALLDELEQYLRIGSALSNPEDRWWSAHAMVVEMQVALDQPAEAREE